MRYVMKSESRRLQTRAKNEIINSMRGCDDDDDGKVVKIFANIKGIPFYKFFFILKYRKFYTLKLNKYFCNWIIMKCEDWNSQKTQNVSEDIIFHFSTMNYCKHLVNFIISVNLIFTCTHHFTHQSKENSFCSFFGSQIDEKLTRERFSLSYRRVLLLRNPNTRVK